MTSTVAEAAVHEDGARMIDWVQRVNSAWGARGESRAAAAEEHLRKLAETDPGALHRKARRAFRLMMDAGQGADLKSAFYQGVFGEA